MSSKPAPITGELRDKLIVGLTMEDALAGINLAMRVRKLELILAYDEDVFPRLYLSMPGVPPEQVMKLDPRKQACYVVPPTNRDLFFAFIDITQRLEKLEGWLRLSAEKTRNGPRKAKLQVHIHGARSIALTIMEVARGKRLTDTSFQLPDGTTP